MARCDAIARVVVWVARRSLAESARSGRRCFPQQL